MLRQLTYPLVTTIAVAQTSAAPRPMRPPGRAIFTASAPGPMQLGKLWMDVGLFHPWTGPISRAEWEQSYFHLLNQATTQPERSQALIAEALGLLKDPASLVLPKEQGTGAHFMPVLWEMREGSPWIIGGDTLLIKAPIGPILSINGQPVKDFLDARIGPDPTEEQILSALYSSGVSSLATAWSLGLADGKTLVIRSTDEPPKDTWIEGGWQGTPIHQLTTSPTEGIDLRTGPWFLADFKRRSTLLSSLARIGRNAERNPVVVLKRRHNGYSETPYGEGDSYASEMIAKEHLLPPLEGQPKSIKVVWPRAPLPPLVNRRLAGWALRPESDAVAEAQRYAINHDWVVRLRVASWGDPIALKSAKGQPSAFRNRTFLHGRNLSKAAAMHLAAATLANFDHLFAFTPVEDQEAHFNALVGLATKANSVADLHLKSGRTSRDPHWILGEQIAGFREILGEAHRDTPVFLAHPNAGGTELLVTHIRVATDGSALCDLPVGTRIRELDGLPVKEWLARWIPLFEFRPGQVHTVVLPALHLASLQLGSAPLKVGYLGPRGEVRTKDVLLGMMASATSRGLKATLGAPSAATPSVPPGWELHTPWTPRRTIQDLIGSAKKGSNHIVDMRFGFGLATSGLPEESGITTFVRSPGFPVAWGSASDTSNEVVGSPQSIQAKMISSPAPGCIVLVVDSTTQSSLETYTELYRWAAAAEGVPVYVVGRPTAGITGPVAYLSLPVGESDRTVPATITASYPIWNYGTFNFLGLPLDHHVTYEELRQSVPSGPTSNADLMLETVVRLAPSLLKQRPRALSDYPNFSWLKEPWGRGPRK